MWLFRLDDHAPRDPVHPDAHRSAPGDGLPGGTLSPHRSSVLGPWRWAAASLALCLAAAPAASGGEERTELDLRGRPQRLHLYGPRDGPAVLVVSGDGGWVHLGVDVAEDLAGRGWRVTGVDAKQYLASFTDGKHTLAPEDVPRDFAALVDYATQGREERIPLVGVSEGAGLCALAAADPALQPRLLGVLGLGLPDENELGWRWKDAVIYLTHGTPKEPTFRSRDYVPRLGAVPLAEIHSTRDEYVPLSEVEGLMHLPGGPKRLWVIDAANHRFSDRLAELQQRLEEAMEWLRRSR